MDNNQPILIFTHIPKTAGTSLLHFIFSEYSFDNIFIYNKTPSNLAQKIQSDLVTNQSDVDIITGHIVFGIHEYLKRPYDYFTVLRHPIARVISHYHHRSRKKEKLSWEKFCCAHSNLMTRYIAGTEFAKIYQQASCRDYISTLHSNPEIYHSLCTHDTLKKAKENLLKYKVVGLTDRFDETLILLQCAFNWKFRFYGKKNVAKKKVGEISSATMDCIKKYNQFDLEFYEYGKSLFEQQLEQQNDLFFEKLALLKDQNSSLYAKLQIEKDNIFILLRRIIHRLKREIL